MAIWLAAQDLAKLYQAVHALTSLLVFGTTMSTRLTNPCAPNPWILRTTEFCPTTNFTFRTMRFPSTLSSVLMGNWELWNAAISPLIVSEWCSAIKTQLPLPMRSKCFGNLLQEVLSIASNKLLQVEHCSENSEILSALMQWPTKIFSRLEFKN